MVSVAARVAVASPLPSSANAVSLAAGAPIRLASAPADTLAEVLSMAMPDAIVLSQSRLQSPANAKHFLLVNPMNLQGGFTHYIAHPHTRVAAGLPFYGVEAIQYGANHQVTRREDGVGYAMQLGTKDDPITFFVNTRGGDSNFDPKSPNGASVNFGIFAKASSLRLYAEGLPSGGRLGTLRSLLLGVLKGVASVDAIVGLAWRGTLQVDKSGQWAVVASGVRFPIGTPAGKPQAAPGAPGAINTGDKQIARINNEAAYLDGANPFQRADDTRPAGGPYLNHGDPVASIAGDVLTLQERVQGTGAAKIRTLSQARALLDDVLDRSHSGKLSTADKALLERLLVQLGRHDFYFGSARIELAAREAVGRSGTDQRASREDRSRVHDVFQGRYRVGQASSYGVGELVRDVLLGVNRYTAMAQVLLDAAPTANEDRSLRKRDLMTGGFETLMKREGGVVHALGLRVPGQLNGGRTQAEHLAAARLYNELTQGMEHPDAGSAYASYRKLDAQARQAIARRIQASLEGLVSSPGTPGAAPVSSRSIAGVPIRGTPSRIESVGGINRSTQQALQGTLMFGRTETGSPLFWLQGRGTNYLLRDAQGAPIGDLAAARSRARELIASGAATDLRPLDKRYLASRTPPGPEPKRAAAPTGTVAGVAIQGSPARLGSVGGINRSTGAALQGELMFARTSDGRPFFWLQGRGTNYPLGDATNAVDAAARARALISNGAATDLRPLPAMYR